MTITLPATTTARASAPAADLEITIRTAAGSGRTLLSAFDHALLQAGVADFNLIPLSSVIPAATRIRHTNERLPGGHGHKLYCVMASAHAEHPGETAWAGLGWVVDPATGEGLFVEHHAGSEESLLELIHLSLEDMKRNRGCGRYGEVQTVTVSAHHGAEPACALALAAYQVRDWRLPVDEDVLA